MARRLPRGAVGHRELIAGNPAPGEVRILIADSSTQEAALVADTYRQWVVGATSAAAYDVSVLFSNANNPGNPQVQAILKTLPTVK